MPQTLRRKIDAQLDAWKSSARRKPLVLNGARQVGKTFSVLAFGERCFDDVVCIDFSAQPDAVRIFDGDILPSALIPQLEALSRRRIDPQRTLLFFDEVQACPRALTSLKYFCDEAPEYYVVAAGSLLGVALGRDTYSYPVGKVNALVMRPLDFEEYLWSRGEELLARAIRGSYERNEPLGLHEHAMDLYYAYLLVGGMPEVVAAAYDGALPSEVRAIQRSICDAYLADMTKYATPIDSAKILSVWRSVPEQLAKENHKFQYATISSSARAHQYEAPIQWLEAAGLVSYCYRVSEGVAPLAAFAERDFFKLYLLDTGLLSALYGLGIHDLGPSDAKTSRLRGSVAENYVMQQLKALGFEPYYWGTTSKAEVDFIVELKGKGAVPVEVKSGKNVTSKSLASFRGAYKSELVLKITARNFGMEHNVKYVPLYAVFCIGRNGE